MAESENVKPKGNNKYVAGVNLLVYTLVGIAIIVLVNWFVSRNDKRWDLTPNKQYSLSPESVKILKGLDHDISFYVFDSDRNMRARHDLMDNYSAITHRVTVHYVDPTRQPAVAREYGVTSDGVIVVVSGDRHTEAKSPDEEGVTNALVHVLKGEKFAYFVQGHGERDLDGTDNRGYSNIKKEFENQNFQVKPLVLMQKMEIPADCSILVIAGPSTDYLPQEIDTIRKYVTNGGRALIMMDPGKDLPNLTKLLADWNVTPENDLVIDLNPAAQIFGTEPTMPLIIKYGASPITEPLARVATLFPITRSFTMGKDSKPGVTVDSLCETSSDSYGINNFDPKVHTISVGFREGKDIRGPLTVAVSGSISGTGDKKGEGRFVAMGTSYLAANGYLGFQGNRDLFMNMVSWLGSEEDMITVRPKPPESQHLDVTAGQMNKILYVGVLGVPLFIIALGASVWWGRR